MCVGTGGKPRRKEGGKMSRKRSEFLGAFGKMFEIVKKIVDAVLEKGGTDEDLERILKEPELAQKMAELVVGPRKSAYKVTVDYAQSLAEMIKAGKYDWVNSDITAEHFPIQGKGKQDVEVVLFHFGKEITSEQVLEVLETQGYRGAKIEEMLALGAAYPELQKQFPILTLGSVWQGPGGSRFVPYLDWDGAGRDLRLDWLGRGWRGYYRFASVRNFLHFPPYFGGFYFSAFSQPPSILLISLLLKKLFYVNLLHI